MKIIINKKTYEFKEGATILDVARENGIHIPTMCYLKELGALTSCFVCVVEVEGRANLLPACAARAEDRMNISTKSEKVLKARRTALELLISDHAGECLALCQRGCPAKIDIPKFLNQLLRGDNAAALRTIKERVAFPAVLGRICPEVCEKSCRRKQNDSAVAICHLKRYAADIDLKSASPYLPAPSADTGKKVVIIGAGPVGLTAAYYLRLKGHAVTVLDKNEKPGGALRYAIHRDRLPESVLDFEIGQIAKLGVVMKQGVMCGGPDLSLTSLVKEYDAVFLACGADPKNFHGFEKECVKLTGSGPEHDHATYRTVVNKVFAGPRTNLTVRASAVGTNAAHSIDLFLKGEDAAVEPRLYSTHLGKLDKEHMALMLQGINLEGRILANIVVYETEKDENPGEKRKEFTSEECLHEASRCMRCDCRKAPTCLLRKYGSETGASVSIFAGHKREFTRDTSGNVVYESGKCISCGICIKICEKNKETLGLTFIGRGFNIKVAVPYEKTVAEGLLKAGEECAANCPTGALVKPSTNYK